MTLSTQKKRYLFLFRGFYWDYWEDRRTGETMKFKMGANPNDYE